MPSLTPIEKKALKLDEKERLELTLKLLGSLEDEASLSNTMDKWAEEAEIRYQAWKRGKVKTISEEEVSKRAEQHLKK